jgi:hypothetical protein
MASTIAAATTSRVNHLLSAATARAFLTAEIAMAAVNCGAPNVTRARAEKLLAEYFTLVEQAIPRTENALDRHS